MLGSRIAHYRIIEPLGEGRLGAMYRARDERSGRDVSVRVLPAGFFAADHDRRGFRHAALQLIRLHHPCVADVIDFVSEDGVDALVCEYVEGETLAQALERGRLTERLAVRVARDVAEGLAAGHERGVVHRFLNPRNIVLGSNGGVKILDFGLPRSADGAVTPPTDHSGSGTPLDRLAYASPEQVSGQRGDARSDLYALGVILFEMLTGERPHDSPDTRSLAFQIAHTPAPLPTRFNRQVPRALEQIVLGCLEKEPGRRYLSGRDLSAALGRLEPRDGSTELQRTMRRVDRFWTAAAVTAGLMVAVSVAVSLNLGRSRERLVNFVLTGETGNLLPGEVRSVAVLPLRSLGPDEDGALSYGVASELARGLLPLRDLRVVAPSSSRLFPSDPDSVSGIARPLRVDAVVSGTVRRAGGEIDLALRARLGASNRTVWTHRASGRFEQLEDLERAALKSLHRTLRVPITYEEAATFEMPRRVAAPALEAYLRARRHMLLDAPSSLTAARDLLNEAVARETLSVALWTALAEVEMRASRTTAGRPDPNACGRVRRAALRAFSIDDQSPAAQAAWAWLRWRCDGQPAEAEYAFLAALGALPNDALTRQAYARFLGTRDRFEERLVQTRRALDADPLSAAIHLDLARCYYHLHQSDRAMRSASRALQLDPTLAGAQALLARVHSTAGRHDSALQADRLADSLGAPPQRFVRLAAARPGEETERVWRSIRGLIDLGELEAFDAAVCQLRSGETSEGLTWLARGIADGSISPEDLRMAPELDAFRADERFQALLSRASPRTPNDARLAGSR